jgi:magnesium transporter
MPSVAEEPSAVEERSARRPEGDSATLTLFDGEDVEQVHDIAAAASCLDGSRFLWIDTGRLSEGLTDRIASAFELGDEAASALAGGRPVRGLRQYDGVTVLAVWAPGGGGDEVAEVTCVVGDQWIVTAHERPVEALEDVAELARGSGPTGELSGPSFLATLLAWVLNAYSTCFEGFEEELETLDERAMRGLGSTDSHIETLVGLRRRGARLRRSLAAHRAALLTLTQPELEAIGDESVGKRFRNLLDDYETTLQTARDARASVVSSFDVVIARTGQRTNEIMKVLTLASVILLPGSLVAGVMGMNFKVGLFQHAALFWVVLAMIAAIAAVTLVVARLRRWI